MALKFSPFLHVCNSRCCLPLTQEKRKNILDIFENPYGAPRPTESQTQPSNRKKYQKSENLRECPKASLITPKVDVISTKSKRYFPKSKGYLRKSKLKYLKEILEEFKLFEISCWGVTVTGFQKYLKKYLNIKSTVWHWWLQDIYAIPACRVRRLLNPIDLIEAWSWAAQTMRSQVARAMTTLPISPLLSAPQSRRLRLHLQIPLKWEESLSVSLWAPLWLICCACFLLSGTQWKLIGTVIERAEKTTTPKISALLRKRPVLLKANFVLTKDWKRPYYGRFCGKIHRGWSCSKAAGGP